MTRAEFDRACAAQNAERAAERAKARESAAPCVVVDMLAFGGAPYCTTHGVMGQCPYGRAS